MCRKLLLVTILSVLLCSCLVLGVEADSAMWSQTYGSAYEAERAYSVIETSDGGYALAGGGMAPVSSYNFFLVKTDEFGQEQWNQTYIGGDGSEWVRSVVQTSDEGYVLAGGGAFVDTGFDFWVVKTDEWGNMQWNQTYGGTEWDEAYCLVQTSDGGYAIAGETGSFGNGVSDFWLIKTGADGTMEWNKTYGGLSFDSAQSLVATSDGGFCMVGLTYSFGAGGSDCWLVKVDSDGDVQWNQTYGGAGSDAGYSLIRTSDGGYAISGASNSSAASYDFWLIKTDDVGNLEWNHTYTELEPYGEARPEFASSLVEASDGGYVLAGRAESENWTTDPPDNFDVLVIKTDGTGNLEWNQTYGGIGDQGADSIIATSDGGYAIAGFSMSFMDGNMDALLIKTDEYGVVPEASWVVLPLLVVATLSVLAGKIASKKKLLPTKY